MSGSWRHAGRRILPPAWLSITHSCDADCGSWSCSQFRWRQRTRLDAICRVRCPILVGSRAIRKLSCSIAWSPPLGDGPGLSIILEIWEVGTSVGAPQGILPFLWQARYLAVWRPSESAKPIPKLSAEACLTGSPRRQLFPPSGGCF